MHPRRQKRKLKDFTELTSLLSDTGERSMAVVNAADEHALESALSLHRKGYASPILIGDENKIVQMLQVHGEAPSHFEIVATESDQESAARSVALARDGQVSMLLKGNVQTRDLLKAVVNHDTGIRDAPVLSHFGLFEVPQIGRVVGMSDGGMILEPDIDQKIEILRNGVEVMHALGVEIPKVGVLAAAELVNPKSRPSVEAREVRDQVRAGAVPECIVEGPISLDLALSTEAVRIKKYEGAVRGDADFLIVPDIVSGNLLGKAFTLCGGAMAGIIVGAKVPIVVTSRASSAMEKYFSVLLALAYSQNKQQ